MEEQIESSATHQTELDDWMQNGCEKAADIMDRIESGQDKRK